MNKTKKLIFIFITLFTSPYVSLSGGIYEEALNDYHVDKTQAHVLELAQSLPQTGVLKRKKNGYAYLDVSNEFHTKLFPSLILDGHLRPTDSFGQEEGAHITVIKEDEPAEGIEDEVGRTFSFTTKELRVIKSTKTYGYCTYVTGYRWILAVESADLEELRLRHGLQPLVEKRDFHITIGFEVPFCRINNFGERP